MIPQEFCCKVLIFAKAPVPGMVKTRLIPSIGSQSAARLHEKLVLRSIEVAVQSNVGPVELWCSPSHDHPFFLGCEKRFGIQLFNQIEGDLGTRMAHGFQETLKSAQAGILIGSDCPSLTAGDFQTAYQALAAGISAVINPAEDGGYVLIGLSRIDPAIFEGIRWGTEVVFEETKRRIERLGWEWKELNRKWDVDRPEDIERLKRASLIDF